MEELIYTLIALVVLVTIVLLLLRRATDLERGSERTEPISLLTPEAEEASSPRGWHRLQARIDAALSRRKLFDEELAEPAPEPNLLPEPVATMVEPPAPPVVELIESVPAPEQLVGLENIPQHIPARLPTRSLRKLPEQLTSRSKLQSALLLQEILSPPLALR